MKIKFVVWVNHNSVTISTSDKWELAPFDFKIYSEHSTRHEANSAALKLIDGGIISWVKIPGFSHQN